MLFPSKVMVRCNDRTVFEINPVTYEAKTCSTYDPWCFTEPESGVKYLSYTEWLNKLEEKRDMDWGICQNKTAKI